MKSQNYKWKGFEIRPEGCLLEQVIDESPRMGIAYERSYGFYKDFHVHDRILLVFPRISCVMEVRTQDPTFKYRVNHSTCLIVPADLKHDDESMGAIYDTFALLPESSLVLEVGRRDGMDVKAINEFLSTPQKIKRSPWLEQLLQQYFFDRIVARRGPTENRLFLENNLVSEVLRIALQPKTRPQQMSLVHDESICARALQFIEINLFSKLDTNGISKAVGTSVATLFREFRREAGKTPSQYIRHRRMEEAMIMLKKGENPIGEIAMLVGYQNFGAFSEAFKSIYKKSPSAFLKK